MDICTDNGFEMFLAQEILDRVCLFLAADTNDICSARLTSKAFNRSAEPHLTDIKSSPSELFHLANETDDTVNKWPNELFSVPYPFVAPVTVWTRLEIPPHVTLEDSATDAGQRFRELMYAPNVVAAGSGLSSMVFPMQGRRRTCWCRVKETSEFWIILQWDGSRSWDAYRRSSYARDLAKFLSDVAPMSIERSYSQRLPLPSRLHDSNWFIGYYEVRTIYFTASMTSEQKNTFNATSHLEKHFNAQGASKWPTNMGQSRWCWLKGLRNFGGQRVVAACFFFNWKNPKLEKSYQKTSSRHPHQHETGAMRRVVEFFDDELRAAGMVGMESLHGIFQGGPWCD